MGDAGYDQEQDFDSDDPLSCDDKENVNEIHDLLKTLIREKLLNDEETKSRFIPENSMSSSILRRNEHLILLDDRFDELEVGALDMVQGV